MTDAELQARIDKFTALKAKFPTSEMPCWTLATTFEDVERYEEAIVEFQACVKLRPDYCVAFLHMGSCLIEIERYDAAIEALETARRLAVEQDHDEPRLKADALIEMANDER